MSATGGLGLPASPLWASASHPSNGQTVLEEPLALIPGEYSWANPSSSKSFVLSSEQQVSPGLYVPKLLMSLS